MLAANRRVRRWRAHVADEIRHAAGLAHCGQARRRRPEAGLLAKHRGGRHGADEQGRTEATQLLLRLVVAFFVTITYLALVQAVQPFRQRGTGTVAVATLSTLACTLFAGLLLRVNEFLPVEERAAFFGRADTPPLLRAGLLRRAVELPSPGATTSCVPTLRHRSSIPSFESTTHRRPRFARPKSCL